MIKRILPLLVPLILLIAAALFVAELAKPAISFGALTGSLVMLQFHLEPNMLISFTTAVSLMFAIARTYLFKMFPHDNSALKVVWLTVQSALKNQAVTQNYLQGPNL